MYIAAMILEVNVIQDYVLLYIISIMLILCCKLHVIDVVCTLSIWVFVYYTFDLI
jgi:hypothetical protein